MDARERQLRRDLDWYRSEHQRLEQLLGTMTPGHAAAVGPDHVRRLEVDSDTFRQLADEHQAYLNRAYPTPDPTSADHVDEGPGLF